ncbi:eukaryotic translation initiation factor 5 [Heterostelium album PN500]|uniref:Eukaryotic translation initiation factor 5 n=1 Tax=Heterostelium pallidum (strain ATCC 26659 / Pp 5 / PN500) TaxID=670386 RepID=D3BMJ9_HETP5|nr:eukaryotic translation initiation factor 5 [Heterostelium album PN500]EFA77211.1 eukaryotic translation initiation factor 5 [Heterostelium album PN500]|eukprot:XP_020429340.1 eukaryotic translation initiation factor 5 [Heterostelium album PN500]
MAQVNIPRTVTDPFYRYKMQVLQTKVEGKGNGIKTVILNLTTIARDLDRTPEYILKFFEIELGSQTNIESERYSVNGSHTVDALAKVLDSFIARYVLCGSCKNPETKFIIKSKTMDLKCAACGNKTPLDIKPKMAAYIMKNPPKATSGSKSRTTADEAPSKPSSKDLKKKKDSDEEEDDDVVWYTDTSEKSVEERKKKAIGGSTAVVMAMMDLGINEITDPVEYLVMALVRSDDDFYKELDNVKEKFALARSYDVARVAVEALANKSAQNMLDAATKKKSLLVKISKKKDGQYGILMGLENVCAADPELLKSVVRIFKSLYDDDIVTEEVFIKWATKSKAKEVKKVVAPFIEWLETAEEDEEDEDEEEEDEEEEDE